MDAVRAFRSTGLVLLGFTLLGCRSGPIEGWSSRARTMVLTSGPTEIAMSSSRVPGYWAREVQNEQEFFLYTAARSFEMGSRVKVEGPFGPADPAVFRDETGVYAKWNPVFVLVVWKMGKEAINRAPRP